MRGKLYLCATPIGNLEDITFRVLRTLKEADLIAAEAVSYTHLDVYKRQVSDIEEIARIVHSFGLPLIVDEAHGAHLPFHPYFPQSALEKGADIVIQSLHKTLPSLTQTGLLHICSQRVSRERVESFLGIYQTSSPSYVLMGSIAACLRYLKTEGRRDFETYTQRLDQCRRKLELSLIHIFSGSSGNPESS